MKKASKKFKPVSGSISDPNLFVISQGGKIAMRRADEMKVASELNVCQVRSSYSLVAKVEFNLHTIITTLVLNGGAKNSVNKYASVWHLKIGFKYHVTIVYLHTSRSVMLQELLTADKVKVSTWARG